MGIHSFKELLAHAGHETTIATYGSPDDPANIAIECTTCSEVLVDFDNPGDEKLQKNRRGVRKVNGVEEDEVFVDTVGGEKLVFSSYRADPEGATYVRIVDERGVELLYWTCQEWEEDPVLVMGAILGAVMRGAIKD